MSTKESLSHFKELKKLPEFRVAQWVNELLDETVEEFGDDSAQAEVIRAAVEAAEAKYEAAELAYFASIKT